MLSFDIPVVIEESTSHGEPASPLGKPLQVGARRKSMLIRKHTSVAQSAFPPSTGDHQPRSAFSSSFRRSSLNSQNLGNHNTPKQSIDEHATMSGNDIVFTPPTVHISPMKPPPPHISTGAGGSSTAMPSQQPFVVSQSSPTALPNELLDLIREFRIRVEKASSQIRGDDAAVVQNLHHSANDIIRYVTNFLILKHEEEVRYEQRKLMGWAAASHVRLDDKGRLVDIVPSRVDTNVLGPFLLTTLYGVMEALLLKLRCDRARIFLPDGNHLRAVVSVGGGAVVAPEKAELNHTVAGAVFRSGVALNIGDTSKAPPHLANSADDERHGYHVRSVLCLPLVDFFDEDKDGRSRVDKKKSNATPATAKKAPKHDWKTPSPRSHTRAGHAAVSFSPNAKEEHFFSDSDTESGGNDSAEGGDDESPSNILGAVEFLNKSKSSAYSSGFTEEDEEAAHQFASLIANLLCWGSNMDLCNNTALEEGAKLQALVLAQRHFAASLRTRTIAGSKPVTRTEAKKIVQKQKEREAILQSREDERIAVEHPFTMKAAKLHHQRHTLICRIAHISQENTTSSVIEDGEGVKPAEASHIAAEAFALIGRGANMRELIKMLEQFDASWKLSRHQSVVLQEKVVELEAALRREQGNVRSLRQMCISCGIMPPKLDGVATGSSVDGNASLDNEATPGDPTGAVGEIIAGGARLLQDGALEAKIDRVHHDLKEKLRLAAARSHNLERRLANTAREEIHAAVQSSCVACDSDDDGTPSVKYRLQKQPQHTTSTRPPPTRRDCEVQLDTLLKKLEGKALHHPRTQLVLPPPADVTSMLASERKKMLFGLSKTL